MRSRNADFDEAEYERPRISKRDALRILTQGDFMRVFQVDEEALVLNGPSVSFNGSPERRGWHFVYARTWGGYPFRAERVDPIVA